MIQAVQGKRPAEGGEAAEKKPRRALVGGSVTVGGTFTWESLQFI